MAPTLGEMDFLGNGARAAIFPGRVLVAPERQHTVTLTAFEWRTNDVSLVQSIALHYAHTYAADADWLRATASAGSELASPASPTRMIRVF